MNEYDRKIGFKTAWLTIVRRWKVILLIMIPACLALGVFTQLMIKKTYQSSTTLINRTNLYQNQHNQIEMIIKGEETLNKTIHNLETRDNPIVLKKSELLSGLSFAAYNNLNPGYVTFSYDSVNKSIIVATMEELTEVALGELATYGYNDLSVLSGPSQPVKSSKENTYFLIGAAVSLVLAYGCAFLIEVVSDEVYDKADIEIYQCSCVEMGASRQRKEEGR